MGIEGDIIKLLPTYWTFLWYNFTMQHKTKLSWVPEFVEISSQR